MRHSTVGSVRFVVIPSVNTPLQLWNMTDEGEKTLACGCRVRTQRDFLGRVVGTIVTRGARLPATGARSRPHRRDARSRERRVRSERSERLERRTIRTMSNIVSVSWGDHLSFGEGDGRLDTPEKLRRRLPVWRDELGAGSLHWRMLRSRIPGTYAAAPGYRHPSETAAAWRRLGRLHDRAGAGPRGGTVALALRHRVR